MEFTKHREVDRGGDTNSRRFVMDKFSRDTELSNEFLKLVLKPIFPNAEFAFMRYFGLNSNQFSTSFVGQISSKELFNNSPYEYKGNGCFLHFTTFPILEMILKTGFIRMSEFNCLSDNNELHFASSSLFDSIYNNSDKLISDKRNLFCLSVCESKIDTITSKFMWNNYAAKGKGCSIEFKFSEVPSYNYLFGRVQYGKRKLAPIKKTISLANQFKTKNNYGIASLPSILMKVFAFHKEMKFKNENEVRLIFHHEDNSLNKELPQNTYLGFHKDNTLKRFIKLYLKGNHDYVKNEDPQMLCIFPQIEITKIILGPNVPLDDKIEIHEFLSETKEKQNRDFEIWEVTNDMNYREININYGNH